MKTVTGDISSMKFRVDDKVAEGIVGNAGNDCANCYQTVING